MYQLFADEHSGSSIASLDVHLCSTVIRVYRAAIPYAGVRYVATLPPANMMSSFLHLPSGVQSSLLNTTIPYIPSSVTSTLFSEHAIDQSK